MCNMSIELKLSDIIQNQAIFNCGTAGHVSHGKSTLIRSLTGVATQRYQKEKERNITIKLGYANCKLFRDPETNAIFSHHSTTRTAKNPETGTELELLYNISFVDCPGHQAYMATMVSGSKIMDHAMVIVAANERIPQPQTHQHLLALGYSRISHLSFALNKMDLVREKDALKIKGRLDTYLVSQDLSGGPVYPISAAMGTNVNQYCHYLASQVSQHLPHVISQSEKPLRMAIVRSYNVNRPNTPLNEMVGAVVGGTIQSGVLSVGDQVELRPGVVHMKDGKKVIQPLVARVISLESDKNAMQTAIPGGLVGVNLSIYAGLSNNDRLKGQVMGHVGQMPNIYNKIIGKYSIIDMRASEDDQLPVLTERSQVNVIVNGTMNVSAKIMAFKPSKKAGKGKIGFELSPPVVMDLEEDNDIVIMLDPKSGGTLAATFSLSSAECDLDVVYPDGVDYDYTPPSYHVVNDLPEYTHEPEEFPVLLRNLSFRDAKAQKVSIPLLSIQNVNRSSFINGSDLSDFLSAMSHGSPAGAKGKPVNLQSAFISNIGKELAGSNPRFNDKGQLVLNGRFRSQQLQSFIASFCKKLLSCPGCGQIKTHLSQDGSSFIRTCLSCPAVTHLHTTDMGKIL